jgi:PadR family transcriptional regulator PadR
MAQVTWPGEWLRGVLQLCVLHVLGDGATYGYAIAQRLGEAGLGTVRGGTLYPLLSRLETDGFVSSTWAAGDGGPGRKYFQLTEDGRAELLTRAQLWHEFAATTARALPPPAGPVRDDRAPTEATPSVPHPSREAP